MKGNQPAPPQAGLCASRMVGSRSALLSLSTRKGKITKMSFEVKLREKGYTVESIELNAGRLMHAKQTGNLIYTSGQVPNREGKAIKGKVGQDLSVEEA